MRHELTWEMQASGRLVAAAVYQRGVMALVLALGSNSGTGSDSTTNVPTTN